MANIHTHTENKHDTLLFLYPKLYFHVYTFLSIEQKKLSSAILCNIRTFLLYTNVFMPPVGCTMFIKSLDPIFFPRDELLVPNKIVVLLNLSLKIFFDGCQPGCENWLEDERSHYQIYALAALALPFLDLFYGYSGVIVFPLLA